MEIENRPDSPSTREANDTQPFDALALLKETSAKRDVQKVAHQSSGEVTYCAVVGALGVAPFGYIAGWGGVAVAAAVGAAVGVARCGRKEVDNGTDYSNNGSIAATGY